MANNYLMHKHFRTCERDFDDDDEKKTHRFGDYTRDFFS